MLIARVLSLDKYSEQVKPNVQYLTSKARIHVGLIRPRVPDCLMIRLHVGLFFRDNVGGGDRQIQYGFSHALLPRPGDKLVQETKRLGHRRAPSEKSNRAPTRAVSPTPAKPAALKARNFFLVHVFATHVLSSDFTASLSSRSDMFLSLAAFITLIVFCRRRSLRASKTRSFHTIKDISCTKYT